MNPEPVYHRDMSRNQLLSTFITWSLLVPRLVQGQHEHGDSNAPRLSVGAHAVGLLTHTTPALQGRDLTEVYLTQPGIGAHASAGALQFNGMVNLEGLTLERGELNHVVWGEGYVDRRHPHTYLHEAVLTWSPRIAATG